MRTQLQFAVCCGTVLVSLVLPFPQDGGTLLIPAAESDNTMLFDWLVKRYQLVPNQWSEVSY